MGPTLGPQGRGLLAPQGGAVLGASRGVPRAGVFLMGFLLRIRETGLLGLRWEKGPNLAQNLPGFGLGLLRQGGGGGEGGGGEGERVGGGGEGAGGEGESWGEYVPRKRRGVGRGRLWFLRVAREATRRRVEPGAPEAEGRELRTLYLGSVPSRRDAGAFHPPLGTLPWVRLY